MSEIKTIWNELMQLGLCDEETCDDPDLQAWLENSQETLEGFWQESSEYIENLTVTELLKLPFTNAQKAVEQFSMKKRLDILEEMSKLRTHYYNQLSRFGEGIPKEEQISATEFRSLLGKIKHIEIVQNWLYGIS